MTEPFSAETTASLLEYQTTVAALRESGLLTTPYIAEIPGQLFCKQAASVKNVQRVLPAVLAGGQSAVRQVVLPAPGAGDGVCPCLRAELRAHDGGVGHSGGADAPGGDAAGIGIVVQRSRGALNRAALAAAVGKAAQDRISDEASAIGHGGFLAGMDLDG